MKTTYKDMKHNMLFNSKFTDMFTYVKKHLLSVAFLAIGATSVWAQTDYSGTYYIGSYGKSSTSQCASANPADNYYLCPTEGWCYYVATNSVQADDNGQPFITSYKCRGTSDYDPNKAVWTIEKAPAPNSDYYYIKQTSTGRYLVYNNQLSGAGANRARVHLETITPPAEPDGNALFAISTVSTGDDRNGYCLFHPKNAGSGFYLNITEGNFNYLTSTSNKQDGPTGYKNVGGIVGQWNETNNTSSYRLEPYSPLISFNTSNEVEITAIPSGATLVYTTDDSTPTSSHGTAVSANTVSFALDEGVTTIKAIAIINGKESGVATFTPFVRMGNTHKYLIQSQNNAWDTDQYHFYMVPGDEDNNKVLRVNTTSLFRPSMEWYFLSAGAENGVQYYYVINNANSKYLAYDDTNKVYMENFGGGGNKFKFRIVESPTTGTYNIKPYGNNNNLNKDTDNANNKVINLNNNNNHGNTRWKFVLPGTLNTSAPFDVSNNTGAHYYKIENVGVSGNFIIPGSPNALVSDGDTNDMNWYFEEVSAPSTSPVQTRYYYIRNAITGDYLYFTKNENENNKGACLATSNTRTVVSEDHYLFTWARTATENTYYIIPKLVKDAKQDYFSSLRKHDNNTSIITNTTRGAGNFAWTFDATHFCNAPVITQTVDRAVTITCPTTPGVDIYYTTDGSEPTFPIGETTTQPYTAPFDPGDADLIKAIAVRQNDHDAQSTVVTYTLPKYTYYIVNHSNKIAAISSPVQQAPGTPLSGHTSIPEAIRSEYLNGETVTFYSFAGSEGIGDEVSEATLLASTPITETPSTSANIYVTYETEHLSGKFLPLTIAGSYNIKYSDGNYRYDNNGTLTTDESEEEYKEDKNHLWYFAGSDPYNVTIQNVSTKNYLNYSGSPSPTLSVGTTQSFILKSTDNHTSLTETAYEDVTFMDASGNEFTLRVNTVVLSLSFTLIDKQGKIIEQGIKYSDVAGFNLPTEWQSPLVSNYNYYKTYSSNDDGVYSFNEGDKVTRLDQLDGNVIYTTYDVRSDFDFDTADNDTVGTTTYMLRFINGTNFKQENAKDSLMTSAQKAVYPYSNGDALLYVYGQEQWDAQLGSGASTRTRWLWYVVSENSDPYHVKIMSHQAQASSHNYFRTYVVNYDGAPHVVTSVTTMNKAVDKDHDNLLPTEYMVLYGQNGHCKLVTADAIAGTPVNVIESYGTRQTVNSFEQYWKNNPTVQKILGKDHDVEDEESYTDDITLTDAQKTQMETVLGSDLYSKWHSYQAYANAAPWVGWKDDNTGTGKQYKKKTHWFQTIDMGNGDFEFEETTLQPQVILLDQHGWEIMRKPMYSDKNMTVVNEDVLKMFESPMVAEYQWYPVAHKLPGYHKFSIHEEDKAIKIYTYNTSTKKWVDSGTTLPQYTSTTLTDVPYLHITPAQDKSVKSDFYVTYTVKSKYTRLYTGAATEGAVVKSPFLIKQGNQYAQADGSTITNVGDPADMEAVPEAMQWYLKPNFNIDAEMGYQYEGSHSELSKANLEAIYFRKDSLNWSNGFDPYNLQIQNVGNGLYFTTDNSGSELTNGIWKASTGSTVNLQSAISRRTADGLDQTTVHITNTTFMVVADANGNMRLMPRFDNSKVVHSFTKLASPAKAAADSISAQQFEFTLVPKYVSSIAEMQNMGGYYILKENFVANGSLGSADNPFGGTIDGRLHTYTATAPLVKYAEDAVIKNIIFNVPGTINSGNTEHHLGAIACTAKGNTRIYNCGILAGELSETGHVGSIVGHLDSCARVINCFSYATIAGGSDVGGIVGYNNVATTAATIAEGTMVMNCMFYGDITGGTNKSPVYGGLNINNVHGGLNTFNYYAYEKLPTSHITSGKYNCALAVEEKYLTRFEIYRQLLNSNRRLAAFYATGDPNKGQGKSNEMAKWVLDKTIASYPVLKAQDTYPSIINYDPINTFDAETGENVTRASITDTEENRNKGRKIGELTVNISVGSGGPTSAAIKDGKSQITLVRTDKDFDDYNYNYDKVQLPYYNEVGTGNYTTDSEGKSKVVTGWKITGMSKDGSSHFDTGDKWGGYNFADRNSTDKDLYGTSGRVFSQGAYFDVPYGVTAITIEPYWGTAAFVADERLDLVYNTSYGAQSVSQLPKTFSNGKITIDGVEQTVHTSIGNALNALSGATVYDNAVVLVGNTHLGTSPSTDVNKKLTIMSIDLDEDNEPDYSLINHHIDRWAVCPIRFDFLNVPGTAQAQKPNGADNLSNVSIFRTKGWFEITNTTLIYFTQFEYENKGYGGSGVSATFNDMQDKPLILLGGVFDQFVSTQNCAVDGHTQYIHVGGNAWFHEFGLGTHSDGHYSTPHPPVSVTGGDYDGFYLTGTYNQNAEVRTDNAECYISGGHFGEAAGASQEAIDGDVRWQIYDADIDNFFGGGVNAAKPITGNVRVDIFNSHVGTYCGGPKFGDMQAGKNVITNAENCTFTKFFGGGYGGTSYSRKKYYDVSGSGDWGNWAKKYTNDRGKYFDGTTTNSKEGGSNDDQYGKKGPGVATDVDYEFFIWSKGNTGGRFFVKFASFTLAKCNDVTSSLKSCHVKENFYGGGNLGKVAGKATSVLDDCTVDGNVFGGGYSATLPKVLVRKAPCFATNPNINKSSGMFEPATLSGTDVYEWKHLDNLPANGNDGMATIDGKNYLYTDVDLTALGQVGETDLTIKGNTTVEGKIFDADGNDTGEQTGGVFGGGDESAVNGDTKVLIQKNESDNTPTVNNVFGGGNTADVDGDASVTMTEGAVTHDVYGGGKGATTTVFGDVLVNIGTKTGEVPSATYDGTGSIGGNVYGGSALGAVNATKAPSTGVLSYTDGKKTDVNIYAGVVSGSVYGGGLGDLSSLGENHADVVAQNYGPVVITIENSDNTKAKVQKAVYGGSNENGVLKSDATVTINGGTIGTVPDPVTKVDSVVFGGGRGEPTLVNGNVTVNIGTLGAASGAIYYGDIYGGSAFGCTNASKNGSDPMVFYTTGENKKTTTVNLYAGTIHGNVYGGGLGQKAKEAVGNPGDPGYVSAVDGVEAFVGGDVLVLLDGAKFENVFTGEGVDYKPVKGQIFGANNQNGTPKGHVKVWVKKTVNVDPAKDVLKSNDATPRDERTTFDVAAVYGGGNQANYVPTGAENEFAEVLIEGCDLTSIEYVYGGGNAAAVPATDVTVLGSYIINYVFGGGNGKGTGNPGADIGILDKEAYDADPSEGIYGTGKADTKLVGGHIMYVFGGSNTKGNVRGGTSISMPDKASYAEEHNCCNERDVKEIYGAGNQADQDGAVTLIVGCVDNMDYVYGGARDAHVKGGVDLVVTSGHFKGVFGGNDTSGSIQGPITLTIEETGCKPLVIDSLYLGGNQAAYSKYGYKDVSGTLTARTKDDYDELTAEQKSAEHLPYADPVLNVVSCTSIGNVFGGGLGATAVMHGSPTVNINLIKGNQVNETGVVLPKAYKDIPNISSVSVVGETITCTINDTIGSIGNIYGGGSAASVKGDTHVNICTEETVAVRSNNGASIVGSPVPVIGATIMGNVFGAGLGLGTEVDSTFVVMTKGTVGKSVYGGGEMGSANGNTHISITGGEIGDKNVVHGGDSIGNVYGGGAFGSVGTYTYNESTHENSRVGDTGTATITITGGTIGIDGDNNGMVFGSSRGDVAKPSYGSPAIDPNDLLAWVYDTHVIIGTENDATPGPVIKGSVYGSGETVIPSTIPL